MICLVMQLQDSSRNKHRFFFNELLSAVLHCPDYEKSLRRVSPSVPCTLFRFAIALEASFNTPSHTLPIPLGKPQAAYGEVDLVRGSVAQLLDGDDVSEVLVQKHHVHVEEVRLFLSVSIAGCKNDGTIV